MFDVREIELDGEILYTVYYNNEMLSYHEIDKWKKRNLPPDSYRKQYGFFNRGNYYYFFHQHKAEDFMNKYLIPMFIAFKLSGKD